MAVQRAQASVIAAVAAPLIGGLCRTLTWKVEGAEHYDAIISSGHQPILACWHGRILTGLYYFRHRGIVALASQNFDGEWIARILERFGIRRRGARRHAAAPGRSCNCAASLRQVTGLPSPLTVRAVPREWRKRAQPGWPGPAVSLSFRSSLESDQFWTPRSWDRAQVRNPGITYVAIAIGEPMMVSGVG